MFKGCCFKIKENGFEVYEVSWDGWGRPLTGGNELITHSGLVSDTRERI